MANESELQNQIKVVGEAWAQSPYYDDAEKWTHLFWNEGTKFRTLFDQMDLTSVVELACGYGRHSEQIASKAGKITMIDIFDQNLDHCRKRLGHHKNIEFLKGDGSSFRPLPDSSVTSIFCYDAMVHFSPDMVKAYLEDTKRVLVSGGMALFHHSNYDAPMDKHYGSNPCARNHMTVLLFAEYATGTGLEIVDQRVMRWANFQDLDGLTLVRKR